MKSGTIREIFWLLPVLSPLLLVVSHFSFVSTWKRSQFSLWFQSSGSPGCCGFDCMVVGFTTTYGISVYHHQSCEFESCSWRGVLDTTLCDKVCQRLATGQWFSLVTPLSFTNKTDHHDITEIFLNVALNTINKIKTY